MFATARMNTMFQLPLCLFVSSTFFSALIEADQAEAAGSEAPRNDNETSGNWQAVRNISSDAAKLRILCERAHNQTGSPDTDVIDLVLFATETISLSMFNFSEQGLGKEPIAADIVSYNVTRQKHFALPPSHFFHFTKVCSISLQGANGEMPRPLLMPTRQENFRQLFDSVANKDQPKIYRNREILLHEADRERKAFDAVKTLVQRKGSMKAENAMRYRRDQVMDLDSASGYVRCASLTNDKLFQSAFRKASILKPFLNELLVVDNLISEKLDYIEIPAVDQQKVSEGKYPMLHDVHASDSKGNAYVIEMERSCSRYDMVRFQHVGYKVFTELVETKIKKLKQKAEDDAETANKAIEEAAETDKTEKAKKAKKVLPKRLTHLDIYKNVPTVIVIVIAEGGLAKKYKSKFTRDGQYTLVVSHREELEDDAKVHFVYVDLARFARTGKGRNPETPLDFWCSILVNSRRLGIEKKLLKKFNGIEGVKELVAEFAELKREEELLEEKMATDHENAKERMAMDLLVDKVRDDLVIKYTGITPERLELLKIGLDLDDP